MVGTKTMFGLKHCYGQSQHYPGYKMENMEEKKSELNDVGFKVNG